MQNKKRWKVTKRTQSYKESFSVSQWIDEEAEACNFGDVRLGRRLKTLVEELSGCVGGSIPFACQDWASTKAAYRFFSNPRVSETDILGGHFESTRNRFHDVCGPALILHDTTEFSYDRESAGNIGLIGSACLNGGRHGRKRRITVRGLLMHSSLAITLGGLPLGLTAVKFWSRKQFKGTNALKRIINPTRVPIEEKESYRWLENVRQSTSFLGAPERCIHIGDRESDIYELFCAAREEGTHFLVRTCVNRLAGDGGHTIADAMKTASVKGIHRVQLRTQNGETSEAVLEIKYRQIQVLPPIGKKARYPQLLLNVIHAKEIGEPKEREPVDWKLVTDLPIDSLAAALEKLRWYSLRWKIEVFHKILKSGCKAEESKLRTAERLVNLIALLCIVSWRIFWMTMVSRTHPEALPNLAFTQEECAILDTLIVDRKNGSTKTIFSYIRKLAMIGGYLARRSDPPPGNVVIWRGMSRLVDIQLGFEMGRKLVGN
ncbi:MAG: IS4 family transposase [Chthoniobacteraceae bacterium]